MPNDTVKPLSDAERAELVALNNEAMVTQAALNRFVAFLQRQHKAPSPEWIIRDASVGFERAPADERTTIATGP
jgi:hypothetical protein